MDEQEEEFFVGWDFIPGLIGDNDSNVPSLSAMGIFYHPECSALGSLLNPDFSYPDF